MLELNKLYSLAYSSLLNSHQNLAIALEEFIEIKYIYIDEQ